MRLEWVEAGTLTPNPKNWRRHPLEQIEALRSAIDEIGWAGALLYNERTKRLIDGHARLEITDPNEIVPVLVVDVDEAVEAKILATLDPIAKMAEGDAVGRVLLWLPLRGI